MARPKKKMNTATPAPRVIPPGPRRVPSGVYPDESVRLVSPETRRGHRNGNPYLGSSPNWNPFR